MTLDSGDAGWEGVILIAGADGKPVPGSDRMLYVETTMFVSEDLMPAPEPRPMMTIETMAGLVGAAASIRRDDLSDEAKRKREAIDHYLDLPPVVDKYGIADTARRRAEGLARMLGLTVVASAGRATADDPFCSTEREWMVCRPRFPPMGFAQGSALASWEPIIYPADGDWPGPFDMSHILDCMDRDEWPPPGSSPEMITLTDPLDDLALWTGVATEKGHLDQWGMADDWLRYDPAFHAQAMEFLQYRRDQQAGGKPLWKVDLRPEPLRNGEWTMFVCHATDTALIPEPNLEALRS